MPNIEYVNPPGTEEIYKKFRFSQATVCGDRVELAGAVGITDEGAVPDDIVEQARWAFRNVQRNLEAAGSDMDHVLHITQYVTDIKDVRTIDKEVFDEFFPNTYPARTVVQVVNLVLPNLRLELQVSAVRK